MVEPLTRWTAACGGARALHAVAVMEGQALVVVNDANLAPSWRDAHVVSTMLDMIAWLERATNLVTVILGGDYAGDREIIGFLRETYPAAQLVLQTT